MGWLSKSKAGGQKPARMLFSEGDHFLPDLCRGQGLLAVLVISELLALLVTISDTGLQYFDWVAFAKISLLSLWIALLSAAVLCLSNRLLSGTRLVTAAVVSFLLILLFS